MSNEDVSSTLPALQKEKADLVFDGLKQQLLCIKDCYLPVEAGFGGMAILSIDKQQAHQGIEVIDAVLAEFSQYTKMKFVIVCDQDVNIRNWNDVIWAITTRMDPARDSKFIDGPQSQLGIDATNKLQGEATREWGRPIHKDKELVARIDKIWEQLNIL
ncbi:hypothetical protein [Vibrio inusitatus]